MINSFQKILLFIICVEISGINAMDSIKTPSSLTLLCAQKTAKHNLEIRNLPDNLKTYIDFLKANQNDPIKALFDAIKKSGGRELLEDLIDCGADICGRGSNGETPLILAAKENHLGAVKLFIERGANINAQDLYRATGLIYAAENGYLSIVQELLLDSTINIDAIDAFKYTALMYAIQNGYALTVQQLLDHGASTNVSDTNILIPLNLAIDRGHTSVVELLAAKDNFYVFGNLIIPKKFIQFCAASGIGILGYCAWNYFKNKLN